MQILLTYALQVLESIWTTTALMAPYLLLGFLIAGILHVMIPESWIQKHLGGRGMWPVVKASLVGVPIPICSCGVIPVAAGLKRNGASRGSTVSFLLSTPQTGVDSIAITWGMLGPLFAIYRTIAAFLSGVIGGLLAETFGGGDEVVKDPAVAACAAHGHEHGIAHGHGIGHVDTGDCCSGPAIPQNRSGRLISALRYGFITLPRDLAKSLMFGLLLAAIFNVFIPDHALPESIGSGIIGYIALMALGIPLYVCATGSVPMVVPLLAKDIISPGAALVFLVSGPATNLASIVTLWKVLGRRTSIIYLVTVAGLALLSGFILDSIMPVIDLGAMAHQHIENVNFLHHLSAAALVAMLAVAILPQRPAAGSAITVEPGVPGESAILDVRGMTCSHCSSSVEKALAEQPGVRRVSVDLQNGTAVAIGQGLDIQSLIKAVDGIGFRASQRG
jgi:uncharacterized membrane protein YraQ (UPF0718 family)/copper chaperone CopZ